MCLGCRDLRNNLKDFKSGNAELKMTETGAYRRAETGRERLNA